MPPEYSLHCTCSLNDSVIRYTVEVFMALKVLTGVLTRLAGASFLLLLILQPGAVRAQTPAPPSPDQILTPNQLDNLVAPIALYPDPLLSQILVAATYP